MAQPNKIQAHLEEQPKRRQRKKGFDKKRGGEKREEREGQPNKKRGQVWPWPPARSARGVIQPEMNTAKA